MLLVGFLVSEGFSSFFDSCCFVVLTSIIMPHVYWFNGTFFWFDAGVVFLLAVNKHKASFQQVEICY